MEGNEIKPSFSLSYLFLTLVTALIIAGAGLLISKYFDEKPRKEIFVYKNEVLRLLGGDLVSDDQIEAQYYLRQPDGEKKRIESLFKSKFFVKNGSDSGIEDLVVTVSLTNDAASLVSIPKINFEPKEISSLVEIKKDESKSSDKKHVWHISLLNPKESVSFYYTAYSGVKIEELNFSVMPRKKDWGVVTQELSPENQTKEISWFQIVAYIPAALIALVVGILVLALPFYGVAWIFRGDYRAFYKRFFRFYAEHDPMHLFESRAKSEFRFRERERVIKKIMAAQKSRIEGAPRQE